MSPILSLITGAKSFGFTSVTPRILFETLTFSSTWIVPAGISKISVFVIGGGGSGSNGSNGVPDTSGAGGFGGGGSPGAAFKDYSVSAGQSFTFVVGGPGLESSFGNLAYSGRGTGQSFQSGSIFPGLNGFTVDGSSGGNGGQSATTNRVGFAGSSGGSQSSLTLDISGIGPITHTFGGGGPGGGSGARWVGSTVPITSGGTGPSSNGSKGGNGGSVPSAGSINGGSASFLSSVYGAGCGGGGGGGRWRNTSVGMSASGTGGSGSNGQFGVIYLYGV